MDRSSGTWRIATKASRRALARGFVVRLGRWMVLGACAALLFVLAVKAVGVAALGPLGAPWPLVFAIAGGSAVLISGVSAWWTRPRPEQAASEVDRALGLRDRLATGLLLDGRSGHADSPFAGWARSEADGAAIRADLRCAMPIRLDRWWLAWPALTAAAVAAALWIPDDVISLIARQARHGPPSVTVADRQKAAREVAAARESVEHSTQDPAIAGARQTQVLREIEEQLLQGKTTPQQARNDAALELERLAQHAEEDAARAAAARDALRDRIARSMQGGSQGQSPLARALRSGDAEAVRAAAEQLIRDTQHLSPAERQALADELGRLARQVEQAAEQSSSPAAPESVPPSVADQIKGKTDPAEIERALREAGAPSEQAEAQARRIAEQSRQEQARDQSRQEAERLKDALEDAARDLREPVRDPGEPPKPKPPEPTSQDRKPPEGDQKDQTTKGDSPGADQSSKGQNGRQPAKPEADSSRDGSNPGKSQPVKAPETNGTEPTKGRNPQPNSGQGEANKGQEPQPTGQKSDQTQPPAQSGKSGEAKPAPGDNPPAGQPSKSGEPAKPDNRGGGSIPKADRGQSKGVPPPGKSPAGQPPGTNPKDQPTPGTQPGDQSPSRPGDEHPAAPVPQNTGQQPGAKGNPSEQGERPLPGQPDAGKSPGDPAGTSPETPSGASEQPNPAGGKQPPGGTPPALPQPGSEGMQRLLDEAKRMADQARRPQQDAAQAEKYREEARRLLEGATPEQREQMRKLAEQMGRRNGSDQPPGSTGKGERESNPPPGPGGGPGDEPSTSGRTPRAAPGDDQPVHVIDARPKDAPTPSGQDRVVAEWLGKGKGQRTEGQQAEAERVIRDAAAGGQRAVEDRTLPSRFDGLLRRYFRRLPEQLGTTAPAPALGEPVPAKDAPPR